MLQRCIDALAARPRIFDALRWVLEGGFRQHRRLIERELLTLTGPILDVGCGTGIFAAMFSATDYLGVDVSSAYIAAASRKCPGHRFAEMDARRLQIADRTFARAFISGMLHHLPDADVEAVLAELARVVQSAGRILIWEDIPTRSAWNVIGRWVHALDLGDQIRPPDGYRQLIERYLAIEHADTLRSGAMDYVVFRCRVR